MPGYGVDLQLASGRRWSHGFALSRHQALWRALTAAGATLRPHNRIKRALAEPALVAFRLHQLIAFGGTFGEYFAYGPKAYLTGLLIWWASWSIGLMLFAAALRIFIESASVLALMLRPRFAPVVRDALEWLGRLAFYMGVPVWLALRLLSNG